MLTYLNAIIGFIIAIGVLTTVHEFGHFWVARKFGVKILRFSIGFGKPLLRWHDRLGTEYAIAAIPLGGYVLMLGEDDEEVPAAEQYMSFKNKSVAKRIAIICAGPFANIMFAIAAYWLVFVIGISSIIPILGDIPKGTVADLANLRRGHEVVKIDEQLTPTWEEVSVALMPHLGEKSFVKVEAYNNKINMYSTHIMNLTDWSVDSAHGDILKSLGLEPFDPVLPIIGKLLPGYPAADSGLLPGDQIIAVDDVMIDTRNQLTQYLRSRPEQAVLITIERDSRKRTFWLTPARKLLEGGDEVGFIGIQYQQIAWPAELIRIQKFGPMVALKKAIVRTKDYTILTIQFLQKIVTGKVSLQHIAGPISIAKYAGQTVQSGAEYFLSFLALISISLAILNMLPVPILDGGHFVFCLLELLNGEPMSKRIVKVGNVFGVIFLASLMLLALYNDVLRL